MEVGRLGEEFSDKFRLCAAGEFGDLHRSRRVDGLRLAGGVNRRHAELVLGVFGKIEHRVGTVQSAVVVHPVPVGTGHLASLHQVPGNPGVAVLQRRLPLQIHVVAANLHHLQVSGWRGNAQLALQIDQARAGAGHRVAGGVLCLHPKLVLAIVHQTGHREGGALDQLGIADHPPAITGVLVLHRVPLDLRAAVLEGAVPAEVNLVALSVSGRRSPWWVGYGEGEGGLDWFVRLNRLPAAVLVLGAHPEVVKVVRLQAHHLKVTGANEGAALDPLLRAGLVLLLQHVVGNRRAAIVQRRPPAEGHRFWCSVRRLKRSLRLSGNVDHQDATRGSVGANRIGQLQRVRAAILPFRLLVQQNGKLGVHLRVESLIREDHLSVDAPLGGGHRRSAEGHPQVETFPSQHDNVLQAEVSEDLRRLGRVLRRDAVARLGEGAPTGCVHRRHSELVLRIGRQVSDLKSGLRGGGQRPGSSAPVGLAGLPLLQDVAGNRRTAVRPRSGPAQRDRIGAGVHCSGHARRPRNVKRILGGDRLVGGRVIGDAVLILRRHAELVGSSNGEISNAESRSRDEAAHLAPGTGALFLLLQQVVGHLGAAVVLRRRPLQRQRLAVHLVAVEVSGRPRPVEDLHIADAGVKAAGVLQHDGVLAGELPLRGGAVQRGARVGQRLVKADVLGSDFQVVHRPGGRRSGEASERNENGKGRSGLDGNVPDGADVDARLVRLLLDADQGTRLGGLRLANVVDGDDAELQLLALGQVGHGEGGVRRGVLGAGDPVLAVLKRNVFC